MSTTPKTQFQIDQERMEQQTPEAVAAINMSEYVWLRDTHNNNVKKIYDNWMIANAPYHYPFPMPMLVKIVPMPDGSCQIVDDKPYEPPVPPAVVVTELPDPLGKEYPGLKGIRYANEIVCATWPDQFLYIDPKGRGNFILNKYLTPFGAQTYFRQVN